MSSPVGHTIVGLALARRLGVRSRPGVLASVLLANLPDTDVLAGVLLRGDPWSLHRRASHTLWFAALAGGVAGAAGAVRADGGLDARTRARDALAGAVIVGSHIVLDRLPYRPIRVGPRLFGMRVINWLLDALQCSVIAWLLTLPDRDMPRPARGHPCGPEGVKSFDP
jgi:membrane-bound metal-dependent hydrolase YbcI (DUF457 family)